LDLSFVANLEEMRRSYDTAGDDAGLTVRYRTNIALTAVMRDVDQRFKAEDGWTTSPESTGAWIRKLRRVGGRTMQRLTLQTDQQGYTRISLKDYRPEWSDSGRALKKIFPSMAQNADASHPN
jgi:hypothetical protein